jgi:hypothetical protein
VTSVTITNNGGSGYTTPPTVTFGAPTGAGGIQATGVARILNGRVVGVTITGNGNLIGLFRSTDQGNTWTSMGVPQDANGPILTDQGNLNLSLLADPNDPTVLFVGGQSQVNAQVTGTWSGRHLRGQFNATTGQTTWTSLDGMVPLNAVHADSRNMVFDPNGNILEVDDGGIYRLSNPNSVAPSWRSVNGNLRVIEFTSIAYDSVNGIVFGGSQDNGSPQQDSPGNRTWTDLSGGDGQIVQVDNTSLPGQSIHYSSSQFLGNFIRRTYDNANRLVKTEFIGLNVTDGRVTGVFITNGGSGYASATVTFSAPNLPTGTLEILVQSGPTSSPKVGPPRVSGMPGAPPDGRRHLPGLAAFFVFIDSRKR